MHVSDLNARSGKRRQQFNSINTAYTYVKLIFKRADFKVFFNQRFASVSPTNASFRLLTQGVSFKLI
jgi:hypothetical protein